MNTRSKTTLLAALLVASACACACACNDRKLDTAPNDPTMNTPLPTGPVAIQPHDTTLRLGADQVFTSSAEVTWSIVETNGGTIDNHGNYRAPIAPGTYHVRVASTADPSLTAIATVHVGPTRLELFSGTLGGSGNADGVGGDARFGWPLRGIVGDGAGVLYVGDSTNHSIRRVVQATGEVTTTAPSLSCRPIALLLGDPHTLYVAGEHLKDTDSVLQTIDLTSGAVTDSLELGPVEINDIAADGAGGFYAVDQFGKLLQINLATRTTTLVATGTRLVSITRDGKGAYLIADDGAHAILRFDPQAITQLSTAKAWEPTSYLTSIRWSTALNDVLVSTDNTLWQLHVDSPDAPSQIAGSLAQTYHPQDGDFGQFPFLSSFWIDPAASSLMVYATDSDLVRSILLRDDWYDGHIGFVTTIAGVWGESEGIAKPHLWGVQMASDASDASGDLLVAGEVWSLKLDSTGHSTTISQGHTDGVAVSSHVSGKVFLAYSAEAYIGSVDGPFATTPFAGEPNQPGDVDGVVGVARVDQPTAMATDDKSLYFVEAKGALRKVDLATREVFTVAPAVFTSVSAVTGLVLDGRGGAFVGAGREIKRVDLATGAVTALVGEAAGFVQIVGLAYDATTSVLYASDEGAHGIRAIDTRTAKTAHLVGTPGRAGVHVGALPASLNAPGGLVLYPNGELAIYDQNERVVVILR